MKDKKLKKMMSNKVKAKFYKVLINSWSVVQVIVKVLKAKKKEKQKESKESD